MSAPLIARFNNFVRVFLIQNPIDLTTAYPYGGTELGSTRSHIWRPEIRHKDITAEEFGGEKVQKHFMGESGVFSAVMRDMDDDMLPLVFRNTSTGTTTGHILVEGSGANRAGFNASSTAIKLLIAPKDAADDDPFLTLYSAVPFIPENAESLFHAQREFGIPIMFESERASNGRKFRLGRRKDIPLP